MTFRQFAYRNIIRNKRTYSAFLLSCAFSVFVFFVYAVFVFHPSVGEGLITEVAVVGMTVSLYVIFGFSFLFVLYSMGTFLTSRKQEFGILVLHGLTKKKLRQLLFFESCLIGFGAILIGVSVGLAFEKLFLMAISKVILLDHMPFYMPWSALGLTVCVFILLFASISYFTSFIVRTTKVRELLQGKEKPESFPIASPFLSILALVLIGGGYLLAFTAESEQVVVRFFPVTLMVVVGTYFFFTQLSIFVMRRLQQNPRKHWKSYKLISRSNLIYRLKDHSRVFFLVSIISTIAICATGTIATFGTTMDRKFEQPMAMTYISLDQMDANQVRQQLSEELMEKQIDYQETSLTLKETEGKLQSSEWEEDYAYDYTLVSLSDFNQLASMLNLPKLDLTDQQVQPLATYEGEWENRREEETLRFEGQSPLVIEDMYPYQVFGTSYFLSVNPVVVSDSVYNDVQRFKEQFFVGYTIADWERTELIGRNLYENELQLERAYFQDRSNPIPTFSFHSSGLLYLQASSLHQTTLLIGSVIGIVFFIATGSFLYYRLYTYLPRDAERFIILRKLGFTFKQINRVVTTEMSLLFFIPFVLSLIHASVAFVALQSMYVQRVNISHQILLVIAGFVAAQVIYFLLMRKQYIQNLRQLIEKP
ncbi:ABC transporter permease [Alkalihalobacillus sp. FSL R5-0424]